MANTILRRTFHCAFASVLAVAVSSAQTPSSCGVAATGIMIYGGSAKPNPPFSATIQTTHDQKFADGNSIHGAIVTHEYRDSTGRIRVETAVMCNMRPDGHFQPDITVGISDPANRTSISWRADDIGEKIARVNHHEPGPKPASAAPAQSPPAQSEEQRKLSALVQAHWRANTRSENLGSKMMAGVLADGTRQITTIPAGEQGNTQPMEISTEVWRAHDTGIAVLHIEEGSTSGRTVTEVTDLNFSEPDPSVFAPPPGYTIKTLTPSTLQ